MISKKELILRSGLELFATEGYAATSTNKIAKKAGVSEGLIFRHFNNKEGLLNAIFELGKEKFKTLYARLFAEEEPTKVIRKMIELPLDLNEEEREFWKFQFRLKWELQHYDHQKIQPLLDKLSWAFAKLNYPSPIQEAEFINNYIEGLASSSLLGREIDFEATKSFLFKKYKIT